MSLSKPSFPSGLASMCLVLVALPLASFSEETDHSGHENMHHGHMMSDAEMTDRDDKVQNAMPMAESTNTPALRDPHAYAGDYEFGKNVDRPPIAHDFYTGALFVNRLEQQYEHGDAATAYDVRAWYGGDFNKVMLKAEGDIDSGELEDARTELLWSTALHSFWDGQIGIRQDSGEGPNRTWLAAGFQGLAPYWFEVDAAAYLSDSGRVALRLEADYELLLTQQWILQPRMEALYFTKNDPDRGIGENLSAVKAGLRLRYEFVPEFAPYIGLEWKNLYGKTKSLAREEGEDNTSVQFVAGLKFWF